MTALTLLTYIAAALLLQVAAGMGVAFVRTRGQRIGRSEAQIERHAEQAAAVPTGAWSGWREFRVLRKVFEDRMRSQCSFYLGPVDGEPLAPFKPGQFLTFSLALAPQTATTAKAAERPVAVVRCYSISDAPDPSAFRITVKRAQAPAQHPEWPAGLASGHLHDLVHEGDVLKVKAPAGQFFIDAEVDVPAVFVAGGIGITPMVSMLRWCIQAQPQRMLHLFYGVRHGGELAFKEALETLAQQNSRFHLHEVFSAPQPGDVRDMNMHHTGRVDVELLRATLPHGRHRFFVCGPPAMMSSLVPALGLWGVLPQDIHFEAFGPASVPPVAASAGNTQAMSGSAPSGNTFNIHLGRSGRTLQWTGQDANLLDFAERHSVAVDSGCRSGSCGSCETRVVSGLVTYPHQPDADMAPGHCLMCVGVPQSALELDL